MPLTATSIRNIKPKDKNPQTLRCARLVSGSLPERKKMMQEWADYLDKLKDGVDVVPLSREA
jgi:hypothetical protein